MVGLYRNSLMRATSWANPKLDLSGCVLYAPLWHPRLGGNVATVQSWPTPNNAPSTLTITGATWGQQGRTFDGLDDLIDCGYNAAYDITGSVTLGVWFYYVTPPLGDGNYTFLAKGRTASGSNKANYILRVGYTAPNNKIQFYYRNSANTAWHTWTSANDPLSTGNWYNLLVGFTFGTPSSLMVLVNGVNVASGGSWTVGDGTAAPITSTEPLYIGSVFPTTGAPAGEEYYDKIGEVWVYNRLLAVTEGQQNRLATKWRY